MAIPLEQESKMWGLFYASDFKRLMFLFIADAFLFLALFNFWGLEGTLIFFFAVLAVATLYFILKSFWPEKHVENIVRFRREGKLYLPGGEESELKP